MAAEHLSSAKAVLAAYPLRVPVDQIFVLSPVAYELYKACQLPRLIGSAFLLTRVMHGLGGASKKYAIQKEITVPSAGCPRREVYVSTVKAIPRVFVSCVIRSLLFHASAKFVDSALSPESLLSLLRDEGGRQHTFRGAFASLSSFRSLTSISSILSSFTDFFQYTVVGGTAHVLRAFYLLGLSSWSMGGDVAKMMSAVADARRSSTQGAGNTTATLHSPLPYALISGEMLSAYLHAKFKYLVAPFGNLLGFRLIDTCVTPQQTLSNTTVSYGSFQRFGLTAHDAVCAAVATALADAADAVLTYGVVPKVIYGTSQYYWQLWVARLAARLSSALLLGGPFATVWVCGCPSATSVDLGGVFTVPPALLVAAFVAASDGVAAWAFLKLARHLTVVNERRVSQARIRKMIASGAVRTIGELRIAREAVLSNENLAKVFARMDLSRGTPMRMSERVVVAGFALFGKKRAGQGKVPPECLSADRAVANMTPKQRSLLADLRPAPNTPLEPASASHWLFIYHRLSVFSYYVGLRYESLSDELVESIYNVLVCLFVNGMPDVDSAALYENLFLVLAAMHEIKRLDPHREMRRWYALNTMVANRKVTRINACEERSGICVHGLEGVSATPTTAQPPPSKASASEEIVTTARTESEPRSPNERSPSTPPPQTTTLTSSSSVSFGGGVGGGTTVDPSILATVMSVDFGREDSFIAPESSMNSDTLRPCVVCLRDVKLGTDDVMVTSCGHTFHTPCLLEAVVSSSASGGKCPMCKAVLCPVEVTVSCLSEEDRYLLTDEGDLPGPVLVAADSGRPTAFMRNVDISANRTAKAIVTTIMIMSKFGNQLAPSSKWADDMLMAAASCDAYNINEFNVRPPACPRDPNSRTNTCVDVWESISNSPRTLLLAYKQHMNIYTSLYQNEMRIPFAKSVFCAWLDNMYDMHTMQSYFPASRLQS